MHQGNREWLAYVQATYGHVWATTGILELGSLDVNGSARSELVSSCHIGVDVTAGPGVDIVRDAEHTVFEAQTFGCILCTSMIEHTPRWREILDHNLQWLRPDGILLLSWGAEGNQHHAPEPWAYVPVGDVLEWLTSRLHIVEACWERSRFTGDCAGCYDVVASPTFRKTFL